MDHHVSLYIVVSVTLYGLDHTGLHLEHWLLVAWLLSLVH